MVMPRSAERGLVVTLWRVEIDLPRSLGYFGGLWLAVTLGLVEPPLALFIAAVPVLRMLGKANLSLPWRFVSGVVSGAAQPIGGAEAERTVRLRDPEEEAARAVEMARATERGQRIRAARSAGRPRPAGTS
ncbi:hypothetical protein HC031_21555 [Planosporangium thailandense]|uniref:Uncharacterized protein n=1 Tax=Planosporangium thailandense TaxID=765197 RepID=A0ABX0Y4D4_9ACTN|nr:hypothetical protein [Planosporangium thailandense]NJC72282.1 hypothetical protein [Planosporangium thailandense]